MFLCLKIAEWLSDGERSAICLKMDEKHRPVKLRKVVLGFPCSNNQTEFKFDLTLNYKIASVVQTYSDQKPTLVVRIIGYLFLVCCSLFNMINTKVTHSFLVLCNKERCTTGCFHSCERCQVYYDGGTETEVSL